MGQHTAVPATLLRLLHLFEISQSRYYYYFFKIKKTESNTLEPTRPLSSVPVRPKSTLKAESLKRAGRGGAASAWEESRRGRRGPGRSAAGLENLAIGHRRAAAKESAKEQGQAAGRVTIRAVTSPPSTDGEAAEVPPWEAGGR